MRPKELVLRCYAENKDGLWNVVCVDLCLAAQGDSFKEAQNKLHDQIKDYVFDALGGEDREYADQLMVRKAPLSLRAKYQMIKAQAHFSHAKTRLFNEMVPMVPAVA
ncbi:MAG: hypothetical protein DRQ97_08585 [Gammaproteobacteria bacterium]|nr:MAG: hypothetical protein DRQ97_08585 [Gammaproteobacteria bacterium]